MILIVLILYCCIIKFPQVLQLLTVHIYFLTEFQKVDHPGVVLPGQRGSLWVSPESAVRLLAGVGIAEWLSGTCASVPSPHGTAGGRSHFLATMWTLLHRATGLLPACCSLPPKQGAKKSESKKNIKTNTTFCSQCLLWPVSEVMTCHHSAICHWSHRPPLVQCRQQLPRCEWCHGDLC